jgi:hypothetical protein
MLKSYETYSSQKEKTSCDQTYWKKNNSCDQTYWKKNNNNNNNNNNKKKSLPHKY